MPTALASSAKLTRSEVTSRLRQWHAEKAMLRCNYKSRHLIASFTACVVCVGPDVVSLRGNVEMEFSIDRSFEFLYSEERDKLEIWFTPTAMELPDSIVLERA